MKQGYKYRRITCELCGRLIATHWYVRHLRRVHIKPLRLPKRGGWASERDSENYVTDQRETPSVE